MTTSAWLGLFYGASELLLSATRRSRGTGVRQDRSTLRVLWVVILSSVAASLYTASHFRGAALPFPGTVRGVAVAIFVLGLALRWWAIVVLGRFFTVDVQIAQDHELVDRGPFRWMRHPSYTGVLLAFLGFGLSLANWAALLVLMLPILAALLHRMTVEEEALMGALGERYVAYMKRTSRLLPGVY
ncbi:MAG: isoprenylcysteine carboxylmethyltransferase family protein [Chthoniobacterales bacterium]